MIWLNYLLIYFLILCVELRKRRDGAMHLFWKVQGAPTLDWHEEERGAHPLSCIGMEGERRRGHALSPLHENPKGAPSVGTPSICPLL